jgi:PAN domain
MQTLIKGRIISIVLACSLLTLLFHTGAFAKDYTRSCRASYSVHPSSIRDGNSYTFEFSGRGTIGYYNPNKARERARRNIDECIDTHWRRYTATSRPDQCTNSNQVYDYPLNSLAVDIPGNICRLNPGHDSISVSITVVYSGDKGCTLDNNSWNRHITRNHLVNCPTREFEENIDRPGMDIRSFVPTAPQPELCREACIAESGCEAWTFVRPGGGQGPGGRCWLKSGVPGARRNNNCVSGVLTPM